MDHDAPILRTLLDTIPTPIFYKDVSGRYLGCNRAFETYIGRVRDELIGRTVFDVAPRELAECYQAKDGELLANPGVQVYQAKVRYADGSDHDVIFHKATFRDGNGAVAGLVGAILDVTDRVRAEQQLRENERKYRSIFESLLDIFYRVSLDGTIEIVSLSVKALAGYEPGELIGRNVMDLYAEPAERLELVAKIGAARVINDHEIKRRCRDGTVRQVSLSSGVVFDADGNPCGIEGIIRDIGERKRMENALRESEERYRTLVDDLPEYVFIYRADRILYANSTIIRTLGYSMAELLSRPLLSFVAERDRQLVGEQVRRRASGQEVPRYEAAIVDAQQREHAVIVSADPIVYQGQPAMLAVLFDISVQREIDRALRESEEKYRLIAEHTADCITVMDLDLRITYVSPSISKIRGYTADEAMTHRLDQILLPESLRRVTRLFEEQMALEAGGQADPERTFSMELDEYHQNGSTVAVEVTMSFLRDDTSRPVGIVTISRDVTQRRLADEALQASEKKYRMLVENQGEGIVIANFDETITYANPAAETIFGVATGTLTGRKTTDFVTSEMAQRLAAETDRRRNGERSRYEIEIIRADGRLRVIRVTAVPQADANGNPSVTFAILQDVTEQRLANERIRVSEEKYRSLFANMRDAFAYHRIVNDEAGRPVDYEFLEVNDAFERMTGLTRGDIIGRRVTEVMPDIKDDPFDWIGAYGTVAQDGRGRRFEQYSKALEKWFAISTYSPTRGFFVTMLDDITERKKRETELRQLSAAVEQSANLIVITDLDVNIVYVNQAFVDLTGYSRSDVLGRNPRLLKSGETAGPVYRQMWQTLLSGGRWRGEFHNRKQNGELYWEEATITSIRGEDGRPAFYMAIKEDITAQRKIREALATSEQRFQQVSDSIGEWVWEIDPEGRYTYSNGAVEGILGYRPEELVGMHFSLLFAPEERDELRIAAMGTIAKHEPIAAFINVNLRKDGRQVTLETNGVPFYDAAGTFMGYRGTDKDITMRQALEEERERLIAELQDSLDNIKTLKGLVPICASCKKIRDDKGYWQQVEVYVSQHTEADFSHGLCDECAHKLYPEYFTARGPTTPDGGREESRS